MVTYIPISFRENLIFNNEIQSNKCSSLRINYPWRAGKKVFQRKLYFYSIFSWDWFRKSSDPKKEKAREICYGVDPEKNFRDDEWAETGTADGCSDDYSGKFAFSEPETKALGKFLLKNRKQIRVRKNILCFIFCC